MIFIVLVGGLGTFEGPIVGAIAFYLIQNQFADAGAWYLVGLGATAIAFALFLPRGLWGTVESRFHLRLLPLGYVLRTAAPDVTVRHGGVPSWETGADPPPGAESAASRTASERNQEDLNRHGSRPTPPEPSEVE
jgi:hypothetical protein